MGLKVTPKLSYFNVVSSIAGFLMLPAGRATFRNNWFSSELEGVNIRLVVHDE